MKNAYFFAYFSIGTRDNLEYYASAAVSGRLLFAFEITFFGRVNNLVERANTATIRLFSPKAPVKYSIILTRVTN